MPFAIPCPACAESVAVTDADRGKTVKCGSCWATVTVPLAAGSAVLAKPVVRATVPAAKPATAIATPVSARVVTAAPVLATVVAGPKVAKPIASAKKSKARSRDDDDRDDDEDGDDAPKKKGGLGVMIGLGVVAVLLIAGCGGIGWVIYDQTKTETASTTPNGGGNDPAKPKNWKAITIGDGFAMDTPDGGISKSDAKISFGTESLDAKKYVKRDNDSSIQITALHCDLKGKALGQYNAKAMMLEMFALPNIAGSDRGARYIGDLKADEFVINIGSNRNHMWIAKLGDRVYGFQFHWENPEPANVNDVKDAFFRSLVVTHVGVETVAPNPFEPGTTPKPIETPWVALKNKSGFAAQAPPATSPSEKIYYDLKQKNFHGRRFTAEDPSCYYYAMFHDLPESEGIDLLEVLKSQYQFLFAVQAADDAKLDGKTATRWNLTQGVPGYGYSVRVGFRVFTFLVTSKIGTQFRADATFAERAELFMKSIKINFDPKKVDLLADDPAWSAMAKTTGFTALAPKGTAVTDARIGFGKDEIKGTEYKSQDDNVNYQIFAYDLPPGKTIDKIVTEQLNRQPITDGPTAMTIDGYGAEELTYRDYSKNPTVMRSVKVGNRAIIAKVSKQGFGKMSDMEFEARRAKFFANFRIGNSGGTVVDPIPGGPTPKPGVTGEFVKAGKVLPFWAAAVLPETKELITVSVRDAKGTKPSGVLRRYGYPDFKLKATYQLPLPVNRIAVDEKAGRLYCASVNAFDKSFLERELAFAAGDVQIFQLNKITEGKLAELEDLKPLSTVNIGTRISGLELSPKDSNLYVSAISQGRDSKGKPIWKGKLYKIETDKQKLMEPMDLPDPVWSIRLSADGGKLYAGEMPLTPGGSPLLGVPRPTNIEVVDTATWKRIMSLVVPGAPLEIAIAGPQTLALVSSKAELSLLAVDDVGAVADVTPRGEALAGARYIRTSPDGKRILVSGGFDNSESSYHDILGDASPRLAKIAGGNVVETLPLGGHFIFSPDGNFAIFNTGVIVDLDKTSGK